MDHFSICAESDANDKYPWTCEGILYFGANTQDCVQRNKEENTMLERTFIGIHFKSSKLSPYVGSNSVLSIFCFYYKSTQKLTTTTLQKEKPLRPLSHLIWRRIGIREDYLKQVRGNKMIWLSRGTTSSLYKMEY